MKANEVPQGKFQAAMFRLSQLLGNSGGELIARLDDDPGYCHRVADYMLRGAPEVSPINGTLTERIARAIMGENMVIGLEKVRRRFGVDLSDELLKRADTVPYLPETLAKYSKTHLLMFGVPVTIKQVFETGKARHQIGISFTGSGFQESGGEMLMKSSSPQSGWFLIAREPEENTEVGLDMCGKRIATIIEAYYAMCLHKTDNPNRYFIRDNPCICHETDKGGTVEFGLGRSFTKTSYGDGSHDYRVHKNLMSTTKWILSVVLPDNRAI